MKARLLLEQFADVSQLTPEHPPVTPVARNGKIEYVFPAGSEFIGAIALQLCRNGQASPADDECRQAVGMSDAQMERQQLSYRMTALGIHSKEDRELYASGVIKGYDEKLNYIPGPNWDAYQKAKADIDKEEI